MKITETYAILIGLCILLTGMALDIITGRINMAGQGHPFFTSIGFTVGLLWAIVSKFAFGYQKPKGVQA